MVHPHATSLNRRSLQLECLLPWLSYLSSTAVNTFPCLSLVQRAQVQHSNSYLLCLLVDPKLHALKGGIDRGAFNS